MKKITLKEMLETEVNDILTNLESKFLVENKVNKKILYLKK